MDSGCTDTIVTSFTGLEHTSTDKSKSFTIADNSIIKSQGTGLLTGGGKNLLVHVIPEFKENLLSISQLYKSGIATIFHPTEGIFIAKAEDIQITSANKLATGNLINGSFRINLMMNDNQVNLTKVVTTDKDLITLIPDHET